MIFYYEHEQYEYIPYNELKESDLPEARRAYKSKYLDLDCAFDIETSSDKKLKLSWMYMWQFAINDLTIIGRTWEEFTEFLELLGRHYTAGQKYKILCWDHNLNYEFSFVKNWLEYEKNRDGDPAVFALNPREVIKLTTAQEIELRDSAVLTNVKLAKLAKDYKTGLKKLTESIDYNQILTPGTPLDKPRLAYAINDVQILAKFNKMYIKPYYLKKGHDIPLTSTAIPRNEMKRRFKQLPKAERVKHRNRIKNSFPSLDEYMVTMRWLYRGGYVHSSIADVFEEFINYAMASMDIKSSYPAKMLQELFPWRFIRKQPSFFYEVCNDKKWIKYNGFYVHLRFKNIRAKGSHSIESKHKLMKYKNALFDNGRLVKADVIDVMLTEQDWLSYQDFYEWDGDPVCTLCKIASKEPLPKFLLDMVLEYFADKEQLDRDTLDYILQKRKLNALYGLCVSGLFHSSLVLNKDGLLVPGEIQKDYKDIVRSQILLPWFGIYISAYARRALLSLVAKLDADCAYCDTDSSKVFDYLVNKYIFDDYNDRIERINKTMYVGDYDRKLFKDIGKFMFEDKYWKFQTNGCKRYIYTTADKDKETGKYSLKNHVTISGMRKGSLENKAKSDGVDIYELFKNGLKLDRLESDKLTTSYCDKEFSLDVVDYLGNEYTIKELSCVTLVEIGFKMTIEKKYLEYYQMYKEKEQLTYGKRI